MVVNPKITPAIKRAGKISHPKKIIIPPKNMKISIKRPITIKIILIIAPKMREIKLEKNASRYLGMSRPRP